MTHARRVHHGRSAGHNCEGHQHDIAARLRRGGHASPQHPRDAEPGQGRAGQGVEPVLPLTLVGRGSRMQASSRPPIGNALPCLDHLKQLLDVIYAQLVHQLHGRWLFDMIAVERLGGVERNGVDGLSNQLSLEDVRVHLEVL